MSKMSQWAAEVFHEERFRGRLMDDEERIAFRLQSRKLNTHTQPLKTAERHKSKPHANDHRSTGK